jgi:hypothetical protein
MPASVQSKPLLAETVVTAGTGWLMTRGTVWSVGESAAGCMTETSA